MLGHSGDSQFPSTSQKSHHDFPRLSVSCQFPLKKRCTVGKENSWLENGPIFGRCTSPVKNGDIPTCYISIPEGTFSFEIQKSLHPFIPSRPPAPSTDRVNSHLWSWNQLSRFTCRFFELFCESWGVSFWCVLYTFGSGGEHVLVLFFVPAFFWYPSLGRCGDVSK